MQGSYVKRNPDTHEGRKDRYGRVIGYDGGHGDTYRQGWRVQWDYGGLQTLQEHQLTVVSREEYEEHRQ